VTYDDWKLATPPEYDEQDDHSDCEDCAECGATPDGTLKPGAGHWTIGVGQIGCLHNHQESDESLDNLLDLAADLYELTTAQKNDLRWNKVVHFEGEQRAMNGDLIELFWDPTPLDESDD
jgi:hypothetical protein